MTPFDESALKARYYHGSEVGEFALIPKSAGGAVIWMIFLMGRRLGEATWPHTAIEATLRGDFDGAIGKPGHKLGLPRDLRDWLREPKKDANRDLRP